MKKFKLLFIILFSLVLFSGCIQVNTKINLNKDGSGTIVETFLMKTSFINMMKDFVMAFDSTKADEFKMFKVEDLKDQASNYGKGVAYKSGEEISTDGYEGYKVTYTFSDINNLKINLNPEDKVPFGKDIENEGNPSEDALKFNFKKGDPSTLQIDFPNRKEQNEEMSEIQDSSAVEDSVFNSDQFQKVVDMFDGMKLSLSVNCEDKVKETDASYVDGSNVTLMAIDFSELIKNKDIIKNLSKSKPGSLEKFKEVIGDIPGIKVETKEKVTIKF